MFAINKYTSKQNQNNPLAPQVCIMLHMQCVHVCVRIRNISTRRQLTEQAF